MKLTVDPFRVNQYADATGVYVRAKDELGKYSSYDIAQLDKASLKEWLLSRNDTQWMLDVIGIILGHGHFKE